MPYIAITNTSCASSDIEAGNGKTTTASLLPLCSAILAFDFRYLPLLESWFIDGLPR